MYKKLHTYNYTTYILYYTMAIVCTSPHDIFQHSEHSPTLTLCKNSPSFSIAVEVVNSVLNDGVKKPSPKRKKTKEIPTSPTGVRINVFKSSKSYSAFHKTDSEDNHHFTNKNITCEHKQIIKDVLGELDSNQSIWEDCYIIQLICSFMTIKKELYNTEEKKEILKKTIVWMLKKNILTTNHRSGLELLHPLNVYPIETRIKILYMEREINNNSTIESNSTLYNIVNDTVKKLSKKKTRDRKEYEQFFSIFKWSILNIDNININVAIKIASYNVYYSTNIHNVLHLSNKEHQFIQKISSFLMKCIQLYYLVNKI